MAWSVQFLCALNNYLSGDREVSKDAMTELYHNLLMQALSKSNHEKSLDFNRTTELVKSINSILQSMILK